MNLYIGIALDDDLTDICVNGEMQQASVPTVVCKEKGKTQWLVGEAAYQMNLKGKGVLVDKLLSLLRKEGTATIEGICCSSEELMLEFLKGLISEQLQAMTEEGEEAPDFSGITKLVLAVRKPEQKLMLSLQALLTQLGIPEERIAITSYTECFVHFVKHQDRNLYNRTVGMFELSNQCLYYYEMYVSRGSRRCIMAESEAQEEAFNLDILKSPAGEKIADRILTSLAERNLEQKSYSAVLLSGRGFENTEFAPDFMHSICTRRRVCIEPRLFAIGAEIRAEDLVENVPEDYRILCDTRVDCDVSVRVQQGEHEEKLLLASAGQCWIGCSTEQDLILNQQNYVDFQVLPAAGQQKAAQYRMILEGFPERESRTTRIRISSRFLDRSRLQVEVQDEGFGELFPKTDAKVSEVLNLEEAGGKG